MDLTDFDALTFDCYGTLVDWERGILDALAPWAARHGLAADDSLLAGFARLEKRIQTADPKMLYRDVLRAVHGAIAAEHGVSSTDEEARTFAESIADWPPFPDTPEALAYLKRHYKLVILSNVDNASFAHTEAKLGVDFDAILTAEDIGSYKPDLRNFRYMLERLEEMGVARAKVLLTAQSLFHDIAPAKALGLATLWVNRRHDRPGGAVPPADAEPDMVVGSLGEVAERHRALTGRG